MLVISKMTAFIFCIYFYTKNVGISFVIVILYKHFLISNNMRKFLTVSILMALLTATGTTMMAQNKQEDYLGLPGDNLNLYAVMKLFQQSKTLEEFERNLNDPKTNINNLDLNGDNMVDYIKVFDDVDGDVHNIILQVAVSPKENQDVAVFTVQRHKNGQVFIQLTGDEELYGKNYIVEPIYDTATNAETPNPGYTGNTRTGQNISYNSTTPVEIAAWPVVRFIYLPTYTVWRSSWYWGYYPSYWHPWSPFSWNYYYGYHYNWYNDYYGHYRLTDNHRYARWNDYYYTSRRSVSSDVNHRIESGTYKATYSHPEERKNGEAMFARTYPDQYRKTQVNSSGNIGTRNNTQTKTLQQNNGNSVSNDRRSTTTDTKKTIVNKPAGNNSTPTRRTSTTVVNKTVANPAPVKNTSVNRTQAQKKSVTVSSPNRRKVNKIKPETTVKKEEKTKDSENKDSNRRN
jgi:hypothetical protein